MPCVWPANDSLMLEYHDKEWGFPIHDDLKHFEFITLDAFQAGLSWRTVLHKRENFRIAFDGFNPSIISKYTEKDRIRLRNDVGIIRNRQKIDATIKNAKAFLAIQQEFGSFDHFIWQFTDYKTIDGNRSNSSKIPATSKESDQMSKVLKEKGFSFVGSTICYAYMQASGMVNDHVIDCPQYSKYK